MPQDDDLTIPPGWNGGRYYILGGRDGHELVKVELLVWAEWMHVDPNRRILAKSRIPGGEVSTVFLGIDHRLYGEGPPVVFESLVFGGPEDGRGLRYCTWREAMDGHRALVSRLRGYAEDE